MTQLEFLLGQKAWANRWMATDAAELPGTLTHDKVAEVSINTEVELVDYMALTGSGMVYLDPENGKAHAIQ